LEMRRNAVSSGQSSLTISQFWGLIIFLISCYCSLADYQHRRILAAAAPLSMLHVRKYHSGYSIIHIFLFASYSHRNANCRAKAKAIAERHAALIPCHLHCTFSPLVNKRNFFPDVVSHPLVVFARNSHRSMQKSLYIRHKLIAGGYGVKRGVEESISKMRMCNVH
jgi:hypothetical protein